jgi:hypothetical protein
MICSDAAKERRRIVANCVLIRQAKVEKAKRRQPNTNSRSVLYYHYHLGAYVTCYVGLAFTTVGPSRFRLGRSATRERERPSRLGGRHFNLLAGYGRGL